MEGMQTRGKQVWDPCPILFVYNQQVVVNTQRSGRGPNEYDYIEMKMIETETEGTNRNDKGEGSRVGVDVEMVGVVCNRSNPLAFRLARLMITDVIVLCFGIIFLAEWRWVGTSSAGLPGP